MANFTGSLTINGISDSDLVRIFEIKLKHEKSLAFNPQQLQTAMTQQHPGHNPQPIQPQQYNNALFGWQNEDGLEAVHQIISMLLKKEEQQPKAA